MSVKKGKKAGKVARAVVSALVQGAGGDAEDQEHLEGGGGEGDVTTAKNATSRDYCIYIQKFTLLQVPICIKRYYLVHRQRYRTNISQ